MSVLTIGGVPEIVVLLDGSVLTGTTPPPTVLAAETTGVRGDQGEPGLAAPQPLRFTQDVPSDTWVMPHDRDYAPCVSVTDSTGALVLVSVTHAPGVATVHADVAFAGTALLL